MQVDLRVDGIAVRIHGGSVLPCRDAGESVVGIDISVIRGLGVVDAAAVDARSGGELVASDASAR